MTLAPIPRRRQHVHSPAQYQSSPTTSSPPPLPLLNIRDEDDFDDDCDLFSQSAYSASIPTPLELSYCDTAADDFFVDSRQSTPYDQSTFDPADTQFMTDNSSQNPRFYLQQSTPDGASETYTPPPMHTGSQQPQQQGWSSQPLNWSQFNNNNFNDPSNPQHHRKIAFRSHKRLSSGSSTGSAGPDSPYTQTSDYPHIVDTDTNSANSPHTFETFDNFYTTGEQFAKPLAAPTNPLNTGALYNPNFSFNPLPTSHAVQYGNPQPAMTSMTGETGRRRSRMGAGNNGLGGEGGSFQPEYEISPEVKNQIPTLDRQMSQAAQDELFNSAMAGAMNYSPIMQNAAQQQQQQQQLAGQVNLLSPTYRSTFNDLRQAANAARSASPSSSLARERSPFREDSEYATTATASEFSQGPNSPASRINSAAQIRAQQKLESDAQAYAQHHPQISQRDFATPNTVSPKETVREYHESEDESGNFALFPQTELLTHENAFPSGPTGIRRPNASASVSQDYGARTGPGPSEFASQAAPPSSNDFSFMAPSVPGVTPPTAQSYPFVSHSRRQSSSLRSQNSEQIPEFPATLSSMESTKSETGVPETVHPPAFLPQSQPSSQEESSPSSPLQRPADTSANSGTFACTAPSCTARFDSGAKLQKHRRDVHRATSPFPSAASNPATPTSSTSAHASTPAASSSSTKPSGQAASSNLSRNNAPGPHKCERINPTTGKPCNTNFSRSYDLTRHEETIHANRKHKVRCQLCTETKTFSRNDALTRHMRVVHPDVEFSGKASRRGGRN